MIFSPNGGMMAMIRIFSIGGAGKKQEFDLYSRSGLLSDVCSGEAIFSMTVDYVPCTR